MRIPPMMIQIKTTKIMFVNINTGIKFDYK